MYYQDITSWKFVVDLVCQMVLGGRQLQPLKYTGTGIFSSSGHLDYIYSWERTVLHAYYTD